VTNFVACHGVVQTTPSMMPDPISTEMCGRSKGCYRNPPGCPADKCDILVTWTDSSQFVDFQLTADTDGWVAIGFSDDLKMVSALQRTPHVPLENGC